VICIFLLDFSLNSLFKLILGCVAAESKLCNCAERVAAGGCHSANPVFDTACFINQLGYNN